MKEIKNLALKNDYFSKLNYEELTQEIKDKALSLLMFMVIKWNEDIKS
jgi:hypothetical protein